MVNYRSYFPVLYRKITYAEFIERIETLYPKLGIVTMTQAAAVFGYKPDDQLKCFYRTGVGLRAQIILNLLEAIPKENLNDLIQEIAKNGTR